MGEKQLSMKMILIVVLAAFLVSESSILMVNGRYLPTRSQDDRLERLRELLKDLLESQNSNNRQQQELSFEQGEMMSGPSSLGGIGSSGRSNLFKRDIHSGSSLLNLNPLKIGGQRVFDGLEKPSTK